MFKLLKGNQSRFRRRVFSEIYSKNSWGNLESVSGPGSTVARTAAFRDDLELLLKEIGVRALLDAPCGDFNWMKELDVGLDLYTGVDIVPEIIAENRRRYGSEKRRFVCLDLVQDRLPSADVILCRDCLAHLPLADALAALRNFQMSGSRYLLTTTFDRDLVNVEIKTGEWQSLNLQQPPFNFPPPLRLIDEKRLDESGEDMRKHLALWQLNNISI